MYISNDSNVILKYFHLVILDRQHIASQWGLQLIFRLHNSDPTPQSVKIEIPSHLKPLNTTTTKRIYISPRE
jgi:hypothetical protein